MKHIVIGTAGHVDHGKTQLVKTLTGQDTDRLKEEKARGISIELGFAPFVLPSGKRTAIIDVPGHERFIKNMLAGVGGIDLVMLVIAADEGVMPQTKEHLNIINLLHIPGGIIVISKADLVDEEWLQLVEAEVREAVEGSVLAHAPIVAVSAVTGQGLDNLTELLEEMVSKIEPKAVSGTSRMSVDRIFSKTGFGTVVTGTLVSGVLKVGDLVEILPEQKEARVRTLQVHGDSVEKVTAGQRVAVNLAGIEMEEFERGSVLTLPNTFEPSYRLDVFLELLPEVEKNLENNKRIRFHLGTKETLGRVSLLAGDELKPGEGAFAQLALEEPVVAGRKDRFVIRSYSPMITIGGGEVIDANPVKHKRFNPEVIEMLKTKQKGTPEDLLMQVLVGTTNRLLTMVEAAAIAGLSTESVKAALENLNFQQLVEMVGGDGKDYPVATVVIKGWEDEIDTMLNSFHRQYPLRLGLAKEELRSKLFSQVPNKLFNLLLDYWQQQNKFQVLDQVVALPGFKPSPDEVTAKLIEKLEESYMQGKFQPPGWGQSINALNVPPALADELLHYFLVSGKLIKLEEDLYFHNLSLQEAIRLIREFLKTNKEIQLGEARDILDSSRKYILPLLEYMDKNRITRRLGDKRVLF